MEQYLIPELISYATNAALGILAVVGGMKYKAVKKAMKTTIDMVEDGKATPEEIAATIKAWKEVF